MSLKDFNTKKLDGESGINGDCDGTQSSPEMGALQPMKRKIGHKAPRSFFKARSQQDGAKRRRSCQDVDEMECVQRMQKLFLQGDHGNGRGKDGEDGYEGDDEA